MATEAGPIAAGETPGMDGVCERVMSVRDTANIIILRALPMYEMLDGGSAWRKQGFRYLHLPLFMILAMLLLLDVVTTTGILLLGGVELNPLMASIVPSVPLHIGVKVLFFAGMFLWVKWWDTRICHAGVTALTVLCTWFTFVVVHNVGSLIPHLAG